MYTQPSGTKYSGSIQGSPYQREMDQDCTMIEDEQQINQILKSLKSRYINMDTLLNDKEDEKQQIIEDLTILNQRLQVLTKSVQRKKGLYEKYDRTLKDAESAFVKITDSTKSLLQIVRSNVGELNRKQK